LPDAAVFPENVQVVRFTVELPEPPPLIETGFMAIAPPLPDDVTKLAVNVQLEILIVAPLPTEIAPPLLEDETAPDSLFLKQLFVIFTVAPVTKAPPPPTDVLFTLSEKRD